MSDVITEMRQEAGLTSTDRTQKSDRCQNTGLHDCILVHNVNTSEDSSRMQYFEKQDFINEQILMPLFENFSLNLKRLADEN